MEAIELLKQQHREVEGLFDRLRGAKRDEKVRLMGQLAEDLTVHAALEERIFYPAALRIRELGGGLAKAQQDHSRVKRLVSELLQVKQTDPAVDALIAELERDVRSHTEEEERDILPRVQSGLDPATLSSVGDEMARAATELRSQDLLEVAESESPSQAPAEPVA
jgi:hemerythrin superfamily protein